MAMSPPPAPSSGEGYRAMSPPPAVPTISYSIAPGAPTVSTRLSMPVPTTRITDAVLLDRIRELRAEVQDLQGILASIRNGEASLTVYAPYILKTKSDIDALMPNIIGGESADAIRFIHNAWEKMSVSPLLIQPTDQYDAKTLLNHLTMLDRQAQQLIFQAGFLTIPDRLQGWLNKSRPGYYIPFHSVFDDEMPSQDDRTRVLQYLGWTPEVLQGGLVDAANGLVYRYSPSTKARVISLLWLLFSLLVATFAVIGSCFVGIAGWPFREEHLPTFILGWVALLMGIAVHALVGNAKQAQAAGSSPPVIAPSEFSARINANLGQLLKLLSIALIVFFITAFTVGISPGLVLSTFLAGYSLDSVLGLGAASLDQQATAQAAIMKKKLGINAQ